jgi:hypothetical protein
MLPKSIQKNPVHHHERGRRIAGLVRLTYNRVNVCAHVPVPRLEVRHVDPSRDTPARRSSHLENFAGRGIFEIVFDQRIACGHLAPFLEVSNSCREFGRLAVNHRRND